MQPHADQGLTPTTNISPSISACFMPIKRLSSKLSSFMDPIKIKWYLHIHQNHPPIPSPPDAGYRNVYETNLL